MAHQFAPRGSKAEVEEGLAFQPKFDADGLIPAIVTAVDTGEVLMFAWMNAEALALTLKTGLGHFWSRSRRALWKKGEESGNFLKVVEMRTDCDQDVVWMSVRVEGDGLACHTGRQSCFYRSIPLGPSSEGGVRLILAAPNRQR
ncbi:MAG TPA: phosphoribosyl-AMP cyclohydrolase [Hyphomicrobium sp.]|nr:phosphoribosyl-AMP cyclohydrolase [Hyphomicrobium sp.]